MPDETSLAATLRALVDAVIEEAAQNEAFAAKVEKALLKLGAPKQAAKPKAAASKASKAKAALPDVHAEWAARGETEFTFWLRDQPIADIRAIIRQLDIDPTRRSSRWKDAEKLARFVSEALKARSGRGAAFLRPMG
jgi:hypothetical protein